MAAPSANLRVRISADLSDIKQGLGLLRGELAKVKAEAAKATPDTSGWTAGIGKIRAQLGNLAGAYVGIRTLTAGIHGLADALERADRIGELALQSGMSTEALSRLAYAAQFSGVNIESLKESVVKFSKEMVTSEKVINGIGVSTRDAAKNFRATEDILLDLADIFAGLPDGPERAALAVKLFGRSGADLIPLLVEGKQKLREYGDQAAATGNVISDAAAASAGEFNDNLDRLKGTLAGVANETIRNVVPAVSGYAEEAAKAGQTSNFAAQGGQFLARVLKVLAAGAIIVKNVVEGLVNVLAFCNTAVSTIAGTILRSFVRSIALVSNVGKNLLAGENPFLVFAKFTKAAGAAVKANLADVTAGKNGIVAGFQSMSSGVSEAASDIANVGKLFADTAADATSATAAIDSGAKGATPASQKLLDILRKLLGSESSGGGSKAKAISESMTLLKDSISRALKELDRMYAASEIGAAQFYAARKQLQEKAIDADIEQAQAELAITKEVGARRKIEEDIVKLQRDRAELGATTAREQAKAEEELAKQLGEVKIRLMELDGDTAAVERANLEEQYLELFKRLDAASDATGRAMVENLIDRLVNKAKLDELRSAADRITSALQGKESSVSAQVSADMLGGIEGEQRLGTARHAALEQMLALRNTTVETLATLDPDSPEAASALEFLGRLDGNIADVVSSMDTLRNSVKDAATEAVTNLFMDLVEGSKSAGEALRDFVRGFAMAMAQIAARALATMLVLQLLDAIWPGSGKMVAAAGGASAGVLHAGGIAGAGGRRRQVNPLLFGHAPRYHKGGIAGTGPDEVPAILQRGEEVLTKNDPRHRFNGGLSGKESMVTTPIVAIGDEAIADAMAGAAGERIVLTHVRRNWGGLSRGH